MRLHVVSSNLKKSNDPDAALAFKRSYIEEAAGDPVVFCFQEVDINALRSGKINVAEKLADGDPFCFTETIAFDGTIEQPSPLAKPLNGTKPWQYGLAVVASGGANIVCSHVFGLGPKEKDFWEQSADRNIFNWEYEPRALAIARIWIPPVGFSCLVGNTHLAHRANRNQSSNVRVKQIETLMHALSEEMVRSIPLALVGDFNATPQNPDIVPIKSALAMAPINEPTKGARNGHPVQIDHAFYRGLKLIERPEVRAVPFSDHGAVITKYDFV